MFVILEIVYGTWGGRKGKENDSAPTISKCITSLQAEDMYTKLLKIGGGREGIKENNRGVELTEVKYIHS
jgi:hypothetical protein